MRCFCCSACWRYSNYSVFIETQITGGTVCVSSSPLVKIPLCPINIWLVYDIIRSKQSLPLRFAKCHAVDFALCPDLSFIIADQLNSPVIWSTAWFNPLPYSKNSCCCFPYCSVLLVFIYSRGMNENHKKYQWGSNYMWLQVINHGHIIKHRRLNGVGFTSTSTRKKCL